MENEEKYTPLELGGKTYKLVYDFDCLVIAEEITGLALLVGVDWSNVGATRIRAMLYASALKLQPAVTLAEFTPYINFTNVLKIEQALVKTWRGASSPDPVETTFEEPKQPEAETVAA